MDLGTALSIIAVALFLTKWTIALRLWGESRHIGLRPGGAILRILAQTLVIIAIGQTFILGQVLLLDGAPMTDGHFAVLVFEIPAELLLLTAYLWAYWRLERFR